MVWLDTAAGTWSAFVLGTQRAGFITAAAAQEAALRLARAQLEEGCAGSGSWSRQPTLAMFVLYPDSGPPSMLPTW